METPLERNRMSLNAVVTRVKNLWAASFQKRYEAAEQLIRLQDNWSLYEEETESSWGDWVNNTFGKGMSRKVSNIVKALKVMEEEYKGTDPRRYLPPEVLVYMANSSVVPRTKYLDVMNVVIAARPLDYQNGRNVINKYLGRTSEAVYTQKERTIWVRYTKKLMATLDKAVLNVPEPPPQLKMFLD